MKKTVLAFGSFDILHPGHLAYLEQARRFGDRLVVVIARDSTICSLKKHAPVFHEKERRALVGSLRIVDKACLGTVQDNLAIVEKIRPTVVCLGYDQRISVSWLKKALRSRNLGYIKIVRAKPYRKNFYKSSLFAARVKMASHDDC